MKSRNVAQCLVRWFARSARDLPWRRTQDPYGIWVSEIMLQQTQVKTVLRYWERWMRELPDIETLASASAAKLHKLWEGLGYYVRVRNLQKAARLILEQHGGRFPSEYEQVLALPGIGRYTAGAICSIAFNQAQPILDGNVIRVLTRVFGVAGNARDKQTNERLWGLAAELVGQARRPAAINQALMELGALICAARQPQCEDCPIAPACVARREGRVAELPNLGARVPVTRRRFAAYVVQRGDRFLVRQRPAGVVNAHLWEFPNVELAPDEPNPAKGLEPLCVIKHSITRYRITLEVYRVTGDRDSGGQGAGGRWLNEQELGRRAFTGAHKQILRRLGIK